MYLAREDRMYGSLTLYFKFVSFISYSLVSQLGLIRKPNQN